MSSARHKIQKNPLLAKFAAELEAEYQGNLRRVMELDRIVFLLVIHDELGIGPGRAARLLDAFQAEKLKLSTDVLKDTDKKGNNDEEAAYSRTKLAQRVYKVLGPRNWIRYCHLFPFIAEFLILEAKKK